MRGRNEEAVINARTAQLQNELWAAIIAPPRPVFPADPLMALVLEQQTTYVEFTRLRPGGVVEPHPAGSLGLPMPVIVMGVLCLVGHWCGTPGTSDN